jgi:hypothetical protein
LSEISYRVKNGTRQKKSNFNEGTLEQKTSTDAPGSLTSEVINQYKRGEEGKKNYTDAAGNIRILYNEKKKER